MHSTMTIVLAGAPRLVRVLEKSPAGANQWVAKDAGDVKDADDVDGSWVEPLRPLRPRLNTTPALQ